MTKPDDDIAGCSGAHARMRQIISKMTDSDIARPSLLPGWTAGHVLAHLARNAEAMCRRIDAEREGAIIEQYPGGAQGRAAAIEAGARRDANELRRDLLDWSSKLEQTFHSLQPNQWNLQVDTVSGSHHSIAELPFRRWREVEVHLVDLDVGVTPSDWPDHFLAQLLPRLLRTAPRRTDPAALAAWLLGRGPAPELTPWG